MTETEMHPCIFYMVFSLWKPKHFTIIWRSSLLQITWTHFKSTFSTFLYSCNNLDVLSCKNNCRSKAINVKRGQAVIGSVDPSEENHSDRSINQCGRHRWRDGGVLCDVSQGIFTLTRHTWLSGLLANTQGQSSPRARYFKCDTFLVADKKVPGCASLWRVGLFKEKA